MGDSRRFDLFAKVVAANFSPDKFVRVADVAGGKGYLSVALKERGFSGITIFDKRKNHLRTKGVVFRYQLFNAEIKDEFDLIVGLHPDEATDVIIVEAARRQVPFVICPCCVKPTVTTFFGNHDYNCWIEHLRQTARKLKFRIIETVLPMQGKNIILIGRP